MTLTQLDHLVAAHRAGSFSQAARECGITQAALSNSIAKLEAELGELLFVRSNVRVSLTPFGVRLLPRVEAILAARDAFHREVAAFGAARSRLVVGHSPLISPPLLQRLLAVLRAAGDRTTVVLSEGNLADLRERVKRRTLDLAVVPHGPSSASLRSLALESEPLCYLAPGWRGARSRPASVTLSAVAKQTFVMVPDACGLAFTTRRLFSGRKVKLATYEEEAMSYGALEEWSATGLGAAILPRSRLSEPERGVPLLARPGEPARISYEVLWHRASSRRLLPFVQAMRRSWA